MITVFTNYKLKTKNLTERNQYWLPFKSKNQMFLTEIFPSFNIVSQILLPNL